MMMNRMSKLLALVGAAGCAWGIAGCSDDPADPVVPTIDISDASIAEGDSGSTLLSFQVTLSEATTEMVSVSYATVDGTATAGSDYTAAEGTLTIDAGMTSQTILLEVLGDTEPEDDETLTLMLSNPVQAILGDAVGLGTITNDEPTFGLLERPANPTCVAPPRPIQNTDVGTEDAFPSAPSFDQATKILQAPGDGSRWFVLEKTGRVRVFNVADPSVVTTYLDFSGVVWTNCEGGLLGMAFHPDFPATPEVYVSHTGFTVGTRVSKFSRMILDDTDNPSNVTEEILLTVNQDFNNHNGGDIAFGNDGYLYIGMGDGGSGGDPNNRAQDTTRLLGSFLRIDVLGVAYPSPGYNIPADNPFAGNAKCGPGGNAADCPETYAWGIRNPWRWSFDRPTGTLWVADVGQNQWEEINIVVNGGNYGWRCREGMHDYNTAGCPDVGLIEPVAEYDHDDGVSITGGFVYRGTAVAALQGRYVFADYVSGRIWALRDNGQGGYINDLLIDTDYYISSFGQDQDGELYIVDYGNGRVRKIIEGGTGSDEVPTLLSQTGCMDPSDITRPYEGMIPYDIAALFWSDGAVKRRYLAIPDGTTVGIEANGDWDFPYGTVIMKDFRLGGQLIETRLLMRHPDGLWGGYTYEWDDAQTEATRIKGGKVKNIGGQDWLYPSEGQCMESHAVAAGVALGPETAQMNREFTYPSTGNTDNQMVTYDHIGLFTDALPDTPENLDALTDPMDENADLEDRARAYLHTNCAQCHLPGGPTPSSMDLLFDTPLADTGTCDVMPEGGDLGIADPRLIAPGDAARSVLINRMNRRDLHGMPRLGSFLVDTDGVALITAWADSLTDCQ